MQHQRSRRRSAPVSTMPVLRPNAVHPPSQPQSHQPRPPPLQQQHPQSPPPHPPRLSWPLSPLSPLPPLHPPQLWMVVETHLPRRQARKRSGQIRPRRRRGANNDWLKQHAEERRSPFKSGSAFFWNIPTRVLYRDLLATEFQRQTMRFRTFCFFLGLDVDPREHCVLTLSPLSDPPHPPRPPRPIPL